EEAEEAQPEHAGVELERPLHVRDAERDVIDALGGDHAPSCHGSAPGGKPLQARGPVPCIREWLACSATSSARPRAIGPKPRPSATAASASPTGTGTCWPTRRPRPSPGAASAAVAPADPVAIVFTSGTTGVPKGACFTHRNLLAVAEIEARRYPPGAPPAAKHLAAGLSFAHVGTMARIAIQLSHRAATLIHD